MIIRRGLAVTLAVAILGGSLLSVGSRPAAAQTLQEQALCYTIIQSQFPAFLDSVQMLPPCTVLAIVVQYGGGGIPPDQFMPWNREVRCSGVLDPEMKRQCLGL